MTKSLKLTASLEDYIEAIFNIIADKGGVRAKDIAKNLGVKAGSVTTALQALAKKGHINYQPYEIITLTSKGMAKAKEVVRKHEILKTFFEQILDGGSEVSGVGACEAEHVVPDELLERMLLFTDFISKDKAGIDFLKRFHQYSVEKIDEIMKLERQEREMSEKVIQSTLLDVENGNKCIVKKINKKASVTKRLVEMGISRGSLIEVERVAPLGDPIEIKVKGCHLSLRKTEAVNIEVELK
jgi:DtxR family Mn-dependent transcriptional regulator